MPPKPTPVPAPPVAHVLLVEDDGPMARFIRTTLKAHDYAITLAATGEEGINIGAEKRPDLLLLDLGLPDQDGLEVIRRLREWSTLPIIVLSARGKEADKVTALDLGADDYLTKPFSVAELLARIRAALRRKGVQESGTPEGSWKGKGLEVDMARHRVFKEGEEVHLTPLEFKLLAALASNAGKVVTHQQLLKEVWGPGSGFYTHYLRIYIASLRKKLEKDPLSPELIRTETGLGYRLVEE